MPAKTPQDSGKATLQVFEVQFSFGKKTDAAGRPSPDY